MARRTGRGGVGGATPSLRLLDARAGGLDAGALRERARAVTTGWALPYSARSYRWPYALVAGHDAPVGVDIERLERVDRAFAESISTPEERAALDAEIADDDVSAWAIASWSGKEALAKALGDAIDYDPRRLGSPMRWPGLRCGPWHAAALSAPPGHTAWLVWTTPRGAPHDPP